MKRHHLRIERELFETIAAGAKTITLPDDRSYAVGDSLMLDNQAAPRWRLRYVQAVTHGQDGTVTLAIYSDGWNP
jgi:hypothetical protein